MNYMDSRTRLPMNTPEQSQSKALPSDTWVPATKQREMHAHIASLFRDPAMLARMDMAFEALMRDTHVMSSPSWWRHIGPKMKYNINFMCEDVAAQTATKGAMQRVVFLCTIMLDQEPTRTLQFGLRSEMLIPGTRYPVADALHVPDAAWVSSGGESKNFGRTAVNFYKTYRERYPHNFANSLISTAYSSDGDPGNGEAARSLIAYLMLMEQSDIGYEGGKLPSFKDMALPQDEVHREYSTADAPDENVEDAPQYDLNDPRSLAEAMRNIQKKK